MEEGEFEKGLTEGGVARPIEEGAHLGVCEAGGGAMVGQGILGIELHTVQHH